MARLRTAMLLAALVAFPNAAWAEPPEDKPKPRTDRYGDPLPEGAIARIGTLRLHHRREVWSVVYSPNGKSLIAGGPVSDPSNSKNVINAVRIWDPATGKLLRTFGAGKYGGNLALSPDGKLLASNPGAARVLLLDATTGREIRECDWNRKDTNVVNVAFSPCERILACCGDGIQFFNPDTGKRLQYFGKSKNRVASIIFSPDGKILASAGVFAGEIRLWDVATGKLVRQLNGRKGSHLAISRDGRFLAAGDGWEFKPGLIMLWDLATGRELRKFKGHSDEVHAVAFSPDGRTLASGSSDRTIRLWDLATGKELQRLEGHHDIVYSLTFAADGKTLVSGGGDGAICIWDVATGKLVHPRYGHHHLVDCLTFAPNSKVLASGSRDGTARLWNAATGKELHRLDEGGDDVTALSFSPDGKVVVTSRKGFLRLWHPVTGQEIRSFKAADQEISVLHFSLDGKQLTTAGYDGFVRQWNATTGNEIHRVRHSSARGETSIAFSPDRHLFAVGDGYDDRIILRELATGQKVRRFGVQERVTALAFSPDGLRLAQGSGTFVHANIRLWDVKTGEELGQFEGHERGTECLTISSDGRLLLSGGQDEAVRLWEIATRQEIRHWEGHDGSVNAVAISPDSRIAASASCDKTIVTWDITGQLDAGVLRPARLMRKELDTCWAKLAAQAAEAYPAVWLLAASDQSVPFLKQRLRPARRVAAERLTRLIAQLDSDDFATREQATQALEELEELAETALRQALEQTKSAEVRARAKRLLKKLSPATLSPERLRQLRAVAALEYNGTSPARKLLQTLAGGAPEARLTREAKASLERLEKRAKK